MSGLRLSQLRSYRTAYAAVTELRKRSKGVRSLTQWHRSPDRCSASASAGMYSVLRCSSLLQRCDLNFPAFAGQRGGRNHGVYAGRASGRIGANFPCTGAGRSVVGQGRGGSQIAADRRQSIAVHADIALISIGQQMTIHALMARTTGTTKSTLWPAMT